jgi:cysteinyl-tRNA synthetase, unknown class
MAWSPRQRVAPALAVAVALAAAAAGCAGAGGPAGAAGPGTPPVSAAAAAGQPAAPDAAAPDAAAPDAAAPDAAAPDAAAAARLTGWVYQLQGYPSGRLDALARAPQRLAVIDLARDAGSGYFRPDEIAALRRSGKTVLAYFEIGSIETFRPEYPPLRRQAGDLILNRWAEWPDEYFVRYWDARWWDRVVRPRVDQALRAGFDGVYLDTPLAYEEIDLALVPGHTRDGLARAMVALIGRISRYARAHRPGFLVFPQNSPELRRYPGYLGAVDGIGMEELFFLATDEPCTHDYCRENLDGARALRAAGKLVLAVDYARQPAHIAAACRRYAHEGFAGYVTGVALDRPAPPCH